MNREKLKEILPHREPMLLVDEAVVDENDIAHATYRVRGDEFFLQGHFPGNPVVPGVILCEIMGQSSAALLAEQIKGKTPYYTGMDSVRFKGKVTPWDVLCITAQVTKSKGVFYFVKSEIRVSEEVRARGELSFAVLEG